MADALEKELKANEKQPPKPGEARALYNKAAQHASACKARCEAANQHVEDMKAKLREFEQIAKQRAEEVTEAEAFKQECYGKLKLEEEGEVKVPNTQQEKSEADEASIPKTVSALVK
eukprot:15093739-Alexandrium_andersonii.AAC.1